MQEEIIKLKEEGKKMREIASILGIPIWKVDYLLHREIKIKSAVEYFKRLSKEKRKLIYKRRLPYIKEYRRKRYKEDEVFRENIKKISRERKKSRD